MWSFGSALDQQCPTVHRIRIRQRKADIDILTKSSGTYNLQLDSFSIKFDGSDFLMKEEKMSITADECHVRFANLRNRHQWWKCSFQCRYHLQSAAANKTFQHRSHQWEGAWRGNRYEQKFNRTTAKMLEIVSLQIQDTLLGNEITYYSACIARFS